MKSVVVTLCLFFLFGHISSVHADAGSAEVKKHSLEPVTVSANKEAEAGYGTFIEPELTAETLARCETAIFTGAAIANGSIEQLISFVPADAAIAVVGPTAGFVPEPLFRRNTAMVGTVVVTDSDQALEILAEGGGGYRLFGECVRKINLLNVDRLQRLGLDDPC